MTGKRENKFIRLDHQLLTSAAIGVLLITIFTLRWFKEGVEAPGVCAATAGIVAGILLCIFVLAILNRSAKKGEFVLRRRLTGLQFLARSLLVVLIFGLLGGVILGTISKYYSLSDEKVAIVWVTFSGFTLGIYWLLQAFGLLWLQRHYGKKFYVQKGFCKLSNGG